MAAHHRKPEQLRVGMISLGCAKNLVDAEIMLGALLRDGLEVTSDPKQADVMIVNTCSFIDSAQEESVDTILESAELRKAHQPGQALVVAGCLSQRFRNELPRLFPEVDAFMGIDQVAEVGRIAREAAARRAGKLELARQSAGVRSRRTILERLAEAKDDGPPEPGGQVNNLRNTDKFGRTRVVVSARGPASVPGTNGAPVLDVSLRPKFIPDYATPRFRLTPRHFAYLKIAEGCNHPCSFCTIPMMRGSHRRRSQADVVAEARALLADGVKELNLISQDSTYYGLDLRPNHSRAIASPERFSAAVKGISGHGTTISSLLRELNALPGEFWIRLLYTHPAHWTDELIRTIAECPKVARYVDIPLQHIHEVMLERMRRETSRQYIEDLLRRIRAGVPGIALRTTFIVGFPGETEEYFQALLGFMREVRFERLGVFTYSREQGTRAAAMAGQVPLATRRRRRDAAMSLQREISREVAASFVGKTVTVLVERASDAREGEMAQLSSWEHGLLRAGGAEVRGKGRYFVARGEADAPDIDGRVLVLGRVKPGEFARVRIVGHTDYDLLGQAV